VFLCDSGQCIEAECDLRNVAGLKEIGSLEDLLIGHAVLLDSSQKGLDILHQQESRARFLVLGNCSRADFVHEVAENHSIFQNLRI
jgi:hypothetical protein